MTERAALAGGFTLLFLALALAPPAAAEEVRPRLNTPMILKMLARPVESPDAAFKEALRKDTESPPVANPDEPQVMPDGSVRYPRTGVTVIIKNPCPPGDPSHETPGYRPLPGRARR